MALNIAFLANLITIPSLFDKKKRQKQLREKEGHNILKAMWNLTQRRSFASAEEAFPSKEMRAVCSR